ncbi:cobalt-precorrin 5A hydrolase [Paenibacillus sp. NPDC057934]|uniref:cobalt-precorrin 5A hydrolase n=1 Tax=Paenibacillus sp. NPDC057934 TaxID=3346282 RepID=UPI0036D95F0E
MSKKYAAVAITRNGIKLALELGVMMGDTDVFCSAKYMEGQEGAGDAYSFSEPLKDLLPELFYRYQGLILFFSLGAVVRLIAPLLQDKKTDPAVVALDERGEHVISVLSGHLGGGNALTQRIAGLLNSRPVITTASDVQGTFAVDLLGRGFGWRADSFEPMKKVSAAIVNDETVVFVQECGEPDWLPFGLTVPENLRIFESISEVVEQGILFSAAVIVTDRQLKAKEEEILQSCSVVYRPRSLVLGIGCNRGTSMSELETVVMTTLDELNLSPLSVRNLATIDIKGNEAGLLELVSKYGWKLITYPAEQLNKVPLGQPSETVFRATGAYGVCEPAALLSSGAVNWLLPKKKSGNVTISVTRVAFNKGNGEGSL